MKCNICGLPMKYIGIESELKGIQEYTDEEGNFHLHDSNKKASVWQCPQKHVFAIIFKIPCPICNFQQKYKIQMSQWTSIFDYMINIKA